jgi:hypothetical protein
MTNAGTWRYVILSRKSREKRASGTLELTLLSLSNELFGWWPRSNHNLCFVPCLVLGLTKIEPTQSCLIQKGWIGCTAWLGL